MPARREPKSSPISLRDYYSDDFRRLWEIDQQCFTRGIAYSQRELAYYIAMAGAFAIVAERADSGANESGAGKRLIVGFLVGQKLPRGLGHIVTIDVVAEARRAGVGSLLMEECEQRLRNAGCSAIYLETAVDNDPALRFYKGRGYSVLKTIPRYYLGKLDALLMGKTL
ncbi:MAG: GNAT family N-acetyltransferase [Acidobacteriia bacterium]|nr:GNAT family N-acetyltransferase [Terriglobia bacterium]